MYEYLSEFRKLCMLLKNKSDYDILYHFVTHLRAEISKEVMKASPPDINTAVRLAQNQEDIFNHFNKGKKKEEKANPKNNQPKKPTPTPQNYAHWFTDTSGYSPMDLDAVGVKNGRKKLSPAERKQLMAAGVCFNCKRPGHTAKFCDQKQQPCPVPGPNPAAASMHQAYLAMAGMPMYNHKLS